jgi:hypothetical protein
MNNISNIKPSISLRILIFFILIFLLAGTYFIITDNKLDYFFLILLIFFDIFIFFSFILINANYSIVNNELIIKYPFLKLKKYNLNEIIGFIIFNYSFKIFAPNYKFEIIAVGNKVNDLFFSIINDYKNQIISNGHLFLENVKVVPGGLLKKTKITTNGIIYKNKLYEWSELLILNKYSQEYNLFFEFKTKSNIKFILHKDMFNGMVGLFSYIENKLQKPN